jgi:hypothetical protein
MNLAATTASEVSVIGIGESSTPQRVYVVGDIHTNTVDGFWSLLKRGINGVYHSVSAKHLQSYLDEYSFRYNHRSDRRPMFHSFISRVSKD